MTLVKNAKKIKIRHLAEIFLIYFYKFSFFFQIFQKTEYGHISANWQNIKNKCTLLFDL